MSLDRLLLDAAASHDQWRRLELAKAACALYEAWSRQVQALIEDGPGHHAAGFLLRGRSKMFDEAGGVMAANLASAYAPASHALNPEGEAIRDAGGTFPWTWSS